MFDWVDYLKLAEYMFKNFQSIGLEEACKRDSISRAYYAAYGVSFSFLKAKLKNSSRVWWVNKNGVKMNKPITYLSHKDTRTWFIEQYHSTGDKELRKVSMLLGKLLGYRKLADYDNRSENITADVIKDSMKFAKIIINIIENK